MIKWKRLSVQLVGKFKLKNVRYHCNHLKIGHKKDLYSGDLINGLVWFSGHEYLLNGPLFKWCSE